MPKTLTADQAALQILLSPYLTEGGRKKALKVLAARTKAQLENRLECPECRHQGPHEDNGANRRDLAYCCSGCGNHFAG